MISELSSAFVRSVLVFLFMLSTFLSHPVYGLQPVAGQLPQGGGNPASSSPFLPMMPESARPTRADPKRSWPDALPSSGVCPRSCPTPTPHPVPREANQRD